MTDPDDDLNLMNAAERQAYYGDMFANKKERLHTLAFPSELTDNYPHLTDEINAAYLRHTIFNVEVWMNYDPASQRFFNDEGRAQDCGKLRLPVTGKRKRKRDDDDEHEGNKAREGGEIRIRSKLEGLEFGRVRFELCTPFTRLGRVLVQVDYDDGATGPQHDPGPQLKPTKKRVDVDDDLLESGFRAVIQRIRAHFRVSGEQGMSFADLEALADEIRLEPKTEDLTFAGWVRDTETWTNFFRAEERNWQGYVYGLH